MPTTITGLEGLKAYTRDIQKKVDKEIPATLEKVGQRLVKEVKFRTPVDTGLLRSSIGWSVVRIAEGWRLIFGSGVKKQDVPYAPYVEYGTPKMQAIPYLRSTWSDKKKIVGNALRRAMNRALKR